MPSPQELEEKDLTQKPPTSSIPVQPEQTDPHLSEHPSARELDTSVAEMRRVGGVERSGFTEEENQLKQEALLNAVIEIEAIIKSAAQATNERFGTERGVRSEIEVLRRTQEERIEEAFNWRRATQEQSAEAVIGHPDEENPQRPEWEGRHSNQDATLPGGDLIQTDRSAESLKSKSDFTRIPSEMTEFDSQHEKLAGVVSGLPAETGNKIGSEDSEIPADVIRSVNSDSTSERKLGLSWLARFGGENAIHLIAEAFDDQSEDVRNVAARAMFDLQPDRVASFARTFREGSPDRRRRIGAALAASGLAGIAIGNLAGETREQGYEAFSLLFLMIKAGEVQPLVRAVEDHPDIGVRLAVVRLLALNGQAEILPAFRQLAVRGVLPSEVRTAVIEAIYEVGRQIPRKISSAGRISMEMK